MHEDYRNGQLKELRDQLTRFAPKGKKIEQADLAENLYHEIDTHRSYALDYVCFRVTNYRREQSSRSNIAGVDVKHDLRLLIEDLSDSADIAIEEIPEQVHTMEDLSKSFRVSTKTISRWRDAGLVSRRFLFGGRKRVGFLHSSVERFAAENRDKIRRGERFSQLTDEEKGEMIERARQMVEGGASLAEVTRELAAQMGRSPETIRYTLKNFDSVHQSVAIFPDHRGALTDDDKRAIFKLHTHGHTVSSLCKRFKRTRTSIHRILLDMRIEQVMELPLDYIYNEEFEVAARKDEFLGELPEPAKAPRKTRTPAGLPSYLAALYDVALLTREQEYHLFRKMNYLKHCASRLREQLDSADADRSSLMNQIDGLYEQAVLVKNKIVQSNLRLVVSIAKRHVKSSDDFFALISDGNMSLIRAAEKFDYSRGNKFSTYASWAIMKNFARTIPSEFKHRDRFRTTTEELFVSRQDNRLDPYIEETVQKTRQRELSKILNRLDDREQKIIVARFGLGRDKEPLTLKEVGEEMGVTKERIRQLEARALSKLRDAADEAKIDVELGA
ncbi:sigma-70 family RNA polymerase sigma factor [Rubripirellula amarantea]|uniref:RNA polymerase sigma factor SigA n=1 Tax=Rubripirellula amarantea TaxID=2527999 RepID=A0A5C5WSU1_9BACT|nr:sigma-70 family RNA polymerase sigma factor [Rubripirellula amarantea]MDA8743083.1 sigma-70 family RNA polymerase sigma factor [Rubripirellula amarantea]TWT53568.1 RNA polymerase sigma factor SigA [Rubripirellula amarantea]